MRRFWKGDDGTVSGLATRLLGSPDLYGHEEREAEQSINFVTCHDGFTLNDLVSYDHKHNEANGEDNRDGSDDNLSWNCGVEGPTDDPDVEALRNRQVKNFLTVLMLAAGTPMLLMGDEVRRTQRGNNNAYCQDGEVSWLDWRLLERHRGLRRFVKGLAAFRLRRDIVGEPFTLNQLLQWARIEWHGVQLGRPDWSDHSHSLAFTLGTPRWRFVLHAMFNAWWEPLTFELPGAATTVPVAALRGHRAAVTRRFLPAGRGAAGDGRHLPRAAALVRRSDLAADAGRDRRRARRVDSTRRASRMNRPVERRRNEESSGKRVSARRSK